jgi:aryl-alcohol dehydrogenase-like predicted oxidoreductase
MAVKMNRRQAMQTLASISVALKSAHGQGQEMTYRTLGKTGEKVSAIGLGGAHIGRAESAELGTSIIRAAIDRGITFMDNCWDYADGEAERRMGNALRDGYRKKVFLMTKFDGRNKRTAAAQIDESLRRLQTDHIDLMQYHENIRMEDPDLFFAEGGPLEALLEARRAGKIRYIGFTGHKDPVVHLRMLEIAAKHQFHFDSCQMPLNVMDYHFRSFAHQVVPKLMEQGIAVLAMKTMGSGIILSSGKVTAIECLHYALNLPTSVVITGMDSLQRVDQAIEAVRTFKPMSQQEVAALVAKTKDAAMTGQFELFKTGTRFDGTAKNPQWMG